MGIRANSRVFLVNCPSDVLDGMMLPDLAIEKRLAGEFEYIHLFVITQAEYKDKFPVLKSHLKPDGMLWVSWPKGGQSGTDLSLPEIIKIGYGFGLVESTCLSINTVWSALKFTHPKKGKVYKNSYGRLA